MSKKKTDAEWREQLSPELFHIARQSGTERPFVGKYTDVYTAGIYHCACCDEPLFKSAMKFPTHCGWPSFAKPIKGAAVDEYTDNSLMGHSRVEVKCHACDAHLGHVFSDGPTDMGGFRYCINSVSLILKDSGGYD